MSKHGSDGNIFHNSSLAEPKLRKQNSNVSTHEPLGLSDVSPKDAPWDKHRKESDMVQSHYEGTKYQKYADRIHNCSTLLDFRLVPTDGESYKLRLSSSFFFDAHRPKGIGEHQCRRLKTLYPQGVIPDFTNKERIIERLIYLSSHAKDEAWKLKARQELTQVGKTRKSKYPDVMSGVININNVKSIFIFQVYDEIVKPQDIESCVARRYTQIARKLFILH